MPNEYEEIFGNPFVFYSYSTSYEFDCAMIDNEYRVIMADNKTIRLDQSDLWRDHVAMYCMMSV